jgi:hypothetical protein
VKGIGCECQGMDDKSGNQFDEEKNRVDGQHDADTGGL